jgi:hypothetical protein
MLSSAQLAIISLSLRFHAMSDIFAVCPPWTNRSSGGPSFLSSSDYTLSIRDKSQTMTRRSLLEEAIKLPCMGLNLICVTSSLWFLNEKSLHLTFLVSQTAIERSADPVIRRLGSKGEASTHIISCMWASILFVGSFWRMSQSNSLLSSLTEAKVNSLKWFQQTSSTTWLWAS